MTIDKQRILRVVRFRPYRKGTGPAFRLVTWDTGRTGYGGKHLVGYRLSESVGEPNAVGNYAAYTVLFDGEDFGCSPLHCIDSDQAVASVMVFLTLRPGDTDAEYFEGYTKRQLEFCSQHAEALSACVTDRFGEM